MASSANAGQAPAGGAGMFGLAGGQKGVPPTPGGGNQNAFSPRAATPGVPGGAPAAPNQQDLAAFENWSRQSLRGNREGRAVNPGMVIAANRAVAGGASPAQAMAMVYGGGGGGGWGAPSGPTTVITPGGGNQNAFSPEPAKVSQVPAGGGYNPMTLRMMLAQMMGGGGARKFSGTGDRGGYTTSGP